MTLVSDIISQSLRESNLIAVGADATPAEAAEALTRLSSIVLSVLGSEIGYVLEDWNVTNATTILRPSGFVANTASFVIPAQARLIANLSVATALNLDPQPQDGQRVSVVDAANNFATRNFTLNGNGRLIDGATSAVLATNLSRKQWVYRADQANWISVEPLSADDQMPFPEEFDDYFIIMLAARMNPRYGKPLTQESALRLEQQRNQLFYRYNQSRVRQAAPAVNRQAGFGMPQSSSDQ